MTWDAIMDAFKRQIPVFFDTRVGRDSILCSRIREVGIRADEDGTFHNVVSGMDKHGNCIYSGTPDMFRLPEGSDRT